MSSLVNLFQQGGWMMFVLLFVGVVIFIAQIVQLVLAKKVDFVPLLWAGLVCTLLLGLLGSLLGIVEAFQAVASASPDMKQTLLAAGISFSLATTTFSVLIALPQAFFTGIVASRVRSVRMSAG